MTDIGHEPRLEPRTDMVRGIGGFPVEDEIVDVNHYLDYLAEDAGPYEPEEEDDDESIV